MMEDDINGVSDTLQMMSSIPSTQVIKHSGYIVNGIHFSTRDRDRSRVTQNSGVSLVAETMQVSSSKDKRPAYSDMLFYGVITEIWELDYAAFRVPLFLCEWVDNESGVHVDKKNGFTSVDLSKLGHKR